MDSRPTGPTGSDVTLLRIVVGPADERRVNWASWVDHVDIDHLSPAAYGLLPALYAAIEPLEIDHPWVARLRGVYRREWTESRRHLASTSAIGQSLSRAGIDCLEPADQQIARVLGASSVQRLDRPRVVVDWWSGPRAVAVLREAGWTVDAPPTGRNARARLTNTRWVLSNSAGAPAELATTFLPHLVDERRETDLWERARSVEGGPPAVAPVDLVSAALCDQLDLPGAVRWVPGVLAVLEAHGPLDLGATFDRREARTVLPMIASRLEFLSVQRLGSQAEDLRRQIDELIARHPVPSSSVDRAVDRLRSRARFVGRQPRAVREIRHRHGGWAGVVTALRKS